MSRERAALGAGLRFSLAAAATTWAAMISWHGFTTLPIRFLGSLVWIGVLIAGVGAVLRWRRVPGVLVLLAQTVAGLGAACIAITGDPLPDSELWSALDSSVDAANTYAAPVPFTDAISVQPLLIVGGVVAMLLVDLLACTLRRVPLAGLPLLTVYSVPISMLDGGLSWWVFAATAGGFLVMLFLQEQEHVGRWGRSLDTGTRTRRSDAVRGNALAVGSVATAAAVLLPLAIPTFDLALFDLGTGGRGNGDISIQNPLVDLRRDLRRGPDIPLVQVTTDDPAPDHLRISVLNRFSSNEWSSGDRDVPAAQGTDGELPPLPGVSPAVLSNATRHDYEVRVYPEFKSLWLPSQAPITSIDASGDWRYDTSTFDFLSSEDDLTSADLDYSMTAVDYDFEESDLRETLGPDDDLDDEVTSLPSGLAPGVTQIARTVTAQVPTKYGKAVALQKWFREDGGFTYSLDRAPEGKVGTDELSDFLNEDTGRVGYCEQFAAAMAVMARTLDIPSRVAVGFLAPDRVQGDTWVYSAHDLHAWPELYFPGAGWVLFDPTPGGPDGRVQDSALPAYTTRGGEDITLPTGSPGEEESRTPSGRPSVMDPPRDDTAPDPAAADQQGSDRGLDLPWLQILLGLAVLALLVLLARLPRTLRGRQRERRLSAGPEAAWAELRATALDLAVPWPGDRSPQETEARLVDHFGRVGDADERPAHGPDLAPDAVDALGRIVYAVELARYALRPDGEDGALREQTFTCCEALAAGVSPRVRRRATWLPRSVVRRTPADGAALQDAEHAEGLVEHI